MGGRADILAGRSYVELLLKNSAFVKGLQQSGEKLRSFGSGIAAMGASITAAGTALITPLIGAIHKFAESGEKLDKMAGRTGVSTEALSELGFAAQQSGQDMEVLENSLKKMQKTVGGAFAGKGESVLALHAISVSVDELRGKKPDQQLEIIAEGLSKIADPSQRAFAAMQIFGRSGTALLPMMQDGAKGIRELREEARELGLSKSAGAARLGAELTEAFNRMKRSIGATLGAVGGALAPTVLRFTSVVTGLIQGVRRWAKENGDLFRSVALVGGGLVIAGTAITSVGMALVITSYALTGFAKAIKFVGSMFGLVTSLASLFLSPVALITAALATGAFVWARYTESGQAAMRGIMAFLGRLKTTFLTTFGGIKDAIMAGDLSLAGEIAMAGLNVSFLQGIAAISKAVGGVWGDFLGKLGTQIAGGDFAGAWSTAITGMASLWDTFCEGIVSVFSQAARVVMNAWIGTQKSIANWLLEDAARGGVVGKTALAGSGVNMTQEQARAERNRQGEIDILQRRLKDDRAIKAQVEKAGAKGYTAEDDSFVSLDRVNKQIAAREKRLRELNANPADFLANTKNTANELLDKSGDRVRKTLDELDRGAQDRARQSAEDLKNKVVGGATGADDGVDESQAKLDALREKARLLKEKAEKEKKLAGGAGADAGADLPNIKNNLFGTFSAAALVAGGGSSPMDRIAKNTEKANEHLAAIRGRKADSAALFAE